MAEILLSLTIIGVVAAITLPSLTGNINERTWNTQRKALYARISQAISLMPALNGYGTLIEGNESTSAVDTATETFITDGLSKVLKINNICDNEHLQDCGIPEKFIPVNIGSSSIPSLELENIRTLHGFNSLFSQEIKAAAFETQNGESILTYYNPYCVGALNETNWHTTQQKMCANFVYDLNGKKGPNTVGKDIGFITVLYPVDSIVVAPLPFSQGAFATSSQKVIGEVCADFNSESRVPNREEVMAIFYNKDLTGLYYAGWWSSSLYSSTMSWWLNGGTGQSVPTDRDTSGYRVVCVKR